MTKHHPPSPRVLSCLQSAVFTCLGQKQSRSENHTMAPCPTPEGIFECQEHQAHPVASGDSWCPRQIRSSPDFQFVSPGRPSSFYHKFKTNNPSGLQSIRSQRVGHDWCNLACSRHWIQHVFSRSPLIMQRHSLQNCPISRFVQLLPFLVMVMFLNTLICIW